MFTKKAEEESSKQGKGRDGEKRKGERGKEGREGALWREEEEERDFL